ncbi:D-cysteine desulfhydrase [Microbulbifer sp. NBRC 101763]|uniref:1-aminocyclopropane-1-carboxylate deaminase/D-cysteine desulfhydrase n=1 Tax=Microbulbifer sp. NBRC 101763 TaxID=1113820 RepID=UPI003097ED9A
MMPHFLDRLDLQVFTDAAFRIPYQQVRGGLFPGLDVWVRRDDLIDPLISGNKAYKLIHNLIEARSQRAETIVTCGGAWSNHIHSVAASGARFGFNTIGIIRGERSPVLSATLRDAERLGMKLIFVTRAQYRRRYESGFIEELGLENQGVYFVPEGGSNLAGVRGTQLLGRVIECTAPVDFDQVWVACGTGATFAGLSSSIQRSSVVGVEVLKAGESVRKSAQHWLAVLGQSSEINKSIQAGVQVPHLLSNERMGCLLGGYHGGGYGKLSAELRELQRMLEDHSGVPIESVYIVKLFNALQKINNSGNISHGERVLIVHSGGLQGRRGYE